MTAMAWKTALQLTGVSQALYSILDVSVSYFVIAKTAGGLEAVFRPYVCPRENDCNYELVNHHLRTKS